MAVGGEFLEGSVEPDAARAVASKLEGLAHHRDDLAGEEAILLRRRGAREARDGEGIDLVPRDLVFAREVLGGLSHGAACRGVEQRLPQEVPELDLAEAEAGAVAIGGDGIARHRFRADAEHEIALPQRDGVGGLGDELEAGAADALHQDRRRLDRHAGIEPDMARQHVGVEARLRHAAGDHLADMLGRHAGAREDGAGGLDAEIDRRHAGERAAIIGKAGAHALQQPDVLVAIAHPARLLGHACPLCPGAALCAPLAYYHTSFLPAGRGPASRRQSHVQLRCRGKLSFSSFPRER